VPHTSPAGGRRDCLRRQIVQTAFSYDPQPTAATDRMQSFRYQRLDVFPARPGGGNPLGVVIDACGWSGADMQRFAAWTNLVETTFLLPAEDSAANYRLRIFTPATEIAFAGHPTVGSAHAALDTGFAQAITGQLIQECAAGLLPIRIEGSGEERELFVQAPRACAQRAGTASAVLRAALGDRALGRLPPPSSKAAAAGGLPSSLTNKRCATGNPITPRSAHWPKPTIVWVYAYSHAAARTIAIWSCVPFPQASASS